MSNIIQFPLAVLITCLQMLREEILQQYGALNYNLFEFLCQREQHFIQHELSGLEGYFSALLEKALFCGICRHAVTFLFRARKLGKHGLLFAKVGMSWAMQVAPTRKTGNVVNLRCIKKICLKTLDKTLKKCCLALITFSMRGVFMNTKLLTSILQSSNGLISSEDFLKRHRIGNAFTRSGKLSFSNLIYFVLQSVHKSIPINYSRFLDNFPSESPPFVSKQAVSKARQGISHKAFLELFRLSVKQFYFRPADLRTWNGFHIYAVDGSTIQIPESEENYEVFGGNPNKTEKVSPLASASVLYDVMNDILVDVSLHSYRYNERESAKSHMDFLPGFPNSVILFDRGYPSEDMFRYLYSKGILFVMRVPKTYKKAMAEQKDALFTYPASRNKESLTLRSIHFLLEDGSIEYLVTNLTSEQMAVENFPDLYRLRWGIESKYRELKNRLEIEAFNSVKPVSIRQEFFAAMYLSNLAAIIKSESDSRIAVSAENRRDYQSNRSYILNRIKSCIIRLLRSSLSVCSEMICRMVDESSKIRSIIRPDRKFGRYRKHTRRRYYNHMKSCI